VVVVKDQINVPPVDLAKCDLLPELSDGSPEGFHTWVKSLILSYKACASKQANLAESIEAYNEKGR
jgi:hypothetical protein